MSWKRIFLIIASSFLISSVSYLAFNLFYQRRDASSPAALRVESLGQPLTVVLDNNILGKTPFVSESLTEGVSSFVLSSEESSYRTKIKLTGGALTGVVWNLGPSEIFSEGEVIWLEPEKGKTSLTVISNPVGAEVAVDDTVVGKTPVSTEQLSAEDHSVRISKVGYKPRLVKIRTQPGYKLSLKSQLFLIPGLIGVSKINFPEEGREIIHDFSTDDPILYSDTKSWARGFGFFLDDQESSISASQKIDFFVDFRGLIFDQKGFKVAESSEIPKREHLAVGYLGKKADKGLTEEARKSLLSLSSRVFVSVNKVEILPTGTGWLRVRSGPSLSADEVARINVGEKVVLLEESGSWYKVKLPDEKTGWISASFAKKL